jgi:hypothetical protein
MQRFFAISTFVAAAIATFAVAAQAELVTPQIVKPQAVTPHVTAPAAAPSSGPAAEPAPSPAPTPNQPQATSVPAAAPSSPSDPPQLGQVPAAPNRRGGPVGYTCPNLTLCELRHQEQEEAGRTEESDRRLWGMTIQGLPWAVAWAMDANPYELWPPNSSPTFGGAGDEVSDAVAALATGALRLFEELLKAN